MFIQIARAAEAANFTATEIAEHTSSTITEAATHGAEVSDSVFVTLGLNPTLFVFQLINFAVVALIIWFLVLKPLTKKISERQEVIEKSLINAEEVESNLRKSEIKYQEKIDQAKSDAAGIIEKAGKEAKDQAEEIKNKSKEEIELLIKQAKKNILIEKDEMIAGIKSQAGELVVAALEKILEDKIDNKKDKEMILRSIKNIKV